MSEVILQKTHLFYNYLYFLAAATGAGLKVNSVSTIKFIKAEDSTLDYSVKNKYIITPELFVYIYIYIFKTNNKVLFVAKMSCQHETSHMLIL